MTNENMTLNGTQAITVYLSSSSPEGSPIPRIVTVPLDKLDGTLGNLLDAVYHYGQNDVQPQKRCSVSVGDVIRVDFPLLLACAAIEQNDGNERTQFYMVDSCGFTPLSSLAHGSDLLAPSRAAREQAIHEARMAAFAAEGGK